MLTCNVGFKLTFTGVASLASTVIKPFSLSGLFTQDEGAELPAQPPKDESNLFMVRDGVRPIVQPTAIEVNTSIRGLGFIPPSFLANKTNNKVEEYVNKVAFKTTKDVVRTRTPPPHPSQPMFLKE